MILLAERDAPLEEACCFFPAVGAQIYGYFDRYQNRYPFCASWVCMDERQRVWGALGRYNGTLRLSCGFLAQEQAQELAGFLSMTGCDTLEGPAKVLEQLQQALERRSRIYSCAAMEYRGGILAADGLERIDASPRLDDVFEILKNSHPHFAATAQYDQWLCDNSHRLRHQKGWTGTLCGKATASVAALSPQYGLIASVATLPEARGKGYATVLTAWCVNKILSSGRIPVLMAGSAPVISLYRRAGFEESGSWGVVSL